MSTPGIEVNRGKHEVVSDAGAIERTQRLPGSMAWTIFLSVIAPLLDNGNDIGDDDDGEFHD